MDNVNFAEYDLNLFLVDEANVPEEHDFYTVQPSAYVDYTNGRSDRFYLKPIVLTLAETRMLKPDFPVDFWGSDFFISLESFLGIAKTIPPVLVNFINDLPEIGSQEMYSRMDSYNAITAPTLS